MSHNTFGNFPFEGCRCYGIWAKFFRRSNGAIDGELGTKFFGSGPPTGFYEPRIALCQSSNTTTPCLNVSYEILGITKRQSIMPLSGFNQIYSIAHGIHRLFSFMPSSEYAFTVLRKQIPNLVRLLEDGDPHPALFGTGKGRVWPLNVCLGRLRKSLHGHFNAPELLGRHSPAFDHQEG